MRTVSSQAPLSWRLLGRVELVAGDQPLPLGRPLQLGLAAYLLLHANQAVPTTRLIEALWGGTPPATARAQVHTGVSRVRRGLAGAGIDPHQILVSEPGGYRITVETSQLDLAEFGELVSRARHARAGRDLVAASELFRCGLERWRGPALTGAAGAFVTAASGQLEDLRLAAWEELAAVELALGRHATLASELRPLVDATPLREPLVARLMLALAGAGQQAEALDLYQVTCSRLAEEFGMEPSQELADAYVRVLRQQERGWVAVHPERALRHPASQPPLTNVVPTTRGGLDGLSPTEGTSQVGQPAPEVKRRVVLPCQLPTDVAGFVGRTTYLDQLDTLLSQPEQAGSKGRIAVISGIAGIGKTALAVHWGHKVRDQFADGQLYIDLGGFGHGRPLAPVEALVRFLRALGMPAEMVPIELAEASAMYRSLLAQKRVLIVLDNAACADQVRPLLPGAGQCVVVITSRNYLGGLVAREGALHLPLGAMAEEDCIALLTHLLGLDRVRIAPDAVMELAKGCAYLPLALRIAAANLQRRTHLDLAAYAAELRGYGRLTSLEVPGDAQASVRAAFGLSYARLDAPARRMFRLLGLVPGPDFTVPVAAALADTTVQEAGSILQALNAANLVEEHSEDRFALHDLLKTYAAERCEQEEPETARRAARDRMYAYLLRNTSRATELLYPHMLRLATGQDVDPAHAAKPFEGHAAALAWLDQERANLVAAVTDASEQGAHGIAWRLADALRGYLLMRMHMVEGFTVARAALASAEADNNLSARAMAHMSHASCLWRLNRRPEAIEQLTRALEYSRTAEWQQCQSAVLGNLGVLYAEEGRTDEAIDHFQQALTLHEQTERRQGQATVLGNLANLYVQSGRLAEAASHAARARAVNAEIGSRDGEAANLVVFAEVHRLSGRFQAATVAAREALDLYRSIGNRTSEGDALRCLSDTACDSGDYALAQQLAASALALSREIGDGRLKADALAASATARLHQGDVTGAFDEYRRAAELATESSQSTAATVALIGLAVTHLLRGEFGPARRWADEAVASARRASFRILEGRALTAAAEIELAADQAFQAIDYGEQASAIHRATGYRLGQAKTHDVLSRAYQRTGNTIAAGAHWHRARSLYADLGLPEPSPPPAIGDASTKSR